MCARFTVLRDTPVALAISGCVIPLSRSNTIWIRCRIFGLFSRLSARCNRLTWSALHLTISAPASNQTVPSESHFAPETNSSLSIQVALEVVLDPWLIADANDNCKAIYLPTVERLEVSVDG